jgi:hypothetical protein
MIFQLADPILDETLLNAARNEKTGRLAQIRVLCESAILPWHDCCGDAPAGADSRFVRVCDSALA